MLSSAITEVMDQGVASEGAAEIWRLLLRRRLESWLLKLRNGVIQTLLAQRNLRSLYTNSACARLPVASTNPKNSTTYLGSGFSSEAKKARRGIIKTLINNSHRRDVLLAHISHAPIKPSAV
jgi:hypothetical protein